MDRLLEVRRVTRVMAGGKRFSFRASVVVGDGAGLVHWLSREDGSALTRMATDGSTVASAPVLAADTLVVVTRSGGIFGFKPE